MINPIIQWYVDLLTFTENLRARMSYIICRNRVETMSSEKEGQEEEGNVSARTAASVAIIDTGLQRLYANLGKFDYKHTNLLSCMTLDVENCNSIGIPNQKERCCCRRFLSWNLYQSSICVQLTAMRSGTGRPPLGLLYDNERYAKRLP